MKKWVIITVLLFFSISFGRCGTDTDYDVSLQDSTFRKFLTDSELDYISSLAEQYGIYKVTYHASGDRILAQRGDSIYISYSGYTFTQTASTFGQGTIFTTNIEKDAVEAGWTPNDLLPTSPAFFILGAGQTLRGIDLGLEGSARGDTARLYLTSDLAYGNDAVGFLSPGTPVVFKIAIDDIKKLTQ